jgi:hypothetical protein
MPAIQPARLRKQCASLAEKYQNPALFVRELQQLLDFYSERVQRSGQAGEPSPLIDAYRVRSPVLRQILNELSPLLINDPGKGIDLCDALWEQPYLEFRQLAASILGEIHYYPPDPVIERIYSWLAADMDDQLVTVLLDDGLRRLRGDNPDLVLNIIEGWFAETDVQKQRFGLRALVPFVSEPSYDNLPVFFRFMQPFSRAAPPELRQDIVSVLQALASRSPNETAYFLRQSLDHSESVDTAWFIRQTATSFPSDVEARLREAVRGRR